MLTERPRLLRAAAVIDADSVLAAPGAVLVEGHRILAAGTPASIGLPANAETIELPNCVLVPALVNAHAHLDLTSLGVQTRTGGFVEWVRGIRSGRPDGDEAIADSVRLGIRNARAGGTALIGDIAGAGSIVPIRLQRDAGLAGVSFLEVFGLGGRQAAAIDRTRVVLQSLAPLGGGVALGIQPHAPYSCGPCMYGFAARCGLPLATHLAETIEEADFTTKGSGAFAELLRELNLWDDTIDVPGCSPVSAVLAAVDNMPILAVHLNHVTQDDLGQLCSARTRVVYCPRASAYFGHARHPYRSMLEAGMQVALGTDSIVCLDTPERISVWDEMRLLHQRDGVAARTLLGMATVNGAHALGFDPAIVRFERGPSAGVLAVHVSEADRASCAENAVSLLSSALGSKAQPEWVVGPVHGEQLQFAWRGNVVR